MTSWSRTSIYSTICQLHFNSPPIGSIFNPWRWIRVDLDSQSEHGKTFIRLLNRNEFVFHRIACGLLELVPFNMFCIQAKRIADFCERVLYCSSRSRARDHHHRQKLKNDKILVSVSAAKMVKQLCQPRPEIILPKWIANLWDWTTMAGFSPKVFRFVADSSFSAPTTVRQPPSCRVFHSAKAKVS